MSTSEKPEAAAAGESTAPRAGGRKTLFLSLIAGVVLLAGLGGAGWWFVLPRFLPPARGEHGKAEARAEVPVLTTVSLGPVVVNLSGEERRYVKVAVALGVPDARQAREVEERRLQLLDLVITVLSNAEPPALASAGGRSELKQELLRRIREELALEKVARVYFTEFVIQ